MTPRYCQDVDIVSATSTPQKTVQKICPGVVVHVGFGFPAAFLLETSLSALLSNYSRGGKLRAPTRESRDRERMQGPRGHQRECNTVVFPEDAVCNHVASRMLFSPNSPMDDGKSNKTSHDMGNPKMTPQYVYPSVHSVRNPIADPHRYGSVS